MMFAILALIAAIGLSLLAFRLKSKFKVGERVEFRDKNWSDCYGVVEKTRYDCVHLRVLMKKNDQPMNDRHRVILFFNDEIYRP